MKKIIFSLLLVLVSTATMFAQAPSLISYQAVIRNSTNQLVANSNVGMQISIIQGSTSGTTVYVERQFPTTNSNGLISIEIGGGTVVSGVFNNIDWSTGAYFIKTETDLNGGSNYTITGTSQILSVPFALYAKKSADGFSGNYSDLTNKPTLSTVATSGSYTDLTSKPTLSTVANTGNYSDLTNKPVLSTVATSGSFSDLTNKPTTIEGYGITNSPKIIAGVSGANGTGYTVSGYTITFTTPFSVIPTATVSLNGNPSYASPYIVSILSISKTQMTVGVYTWINSGSSPVAQANVPGQNFSFIVVGQ